MKLFLSILFCIAVLTSFAQKDSTRIRERPHNYYFYSSDGVTEVATKDSADYIEVITAPEKKEKLFDVKRYYKDGKIYFMGKTKDHHPLNLDGQYISFYQNGKKKEIAKFDENRRVGEAYTYFPNGKLYLQVEYLSEPQKIRSIMNPHKRDTLIKFAYDTSGNEMVTDGKGHLKIYAEDFKTIAEEGDVINFKRNGNWKGFNKVFGVTFTENYADGKLKEGNAADAAGNHFSYTERIKEPGYIDGKDKFFKNIVNNLRYPRYSRENDHQGNEVIRIFIDTTGKVTAYVPMQSVDEYIEAECIRVLKLQPYYNIPAEFFGQKRASFKDSSLSFTLQ